MSKGRKISSLLLAWELESMAGNSREANFLYERTVLGECGSGVPISGNIQQKLIIFVMDDTEEISEYTGSLDW